MSDSIVDESLSKEEHLEKTRELVKEKISETINQRIEEKYGKKDKVKEEEEGEPSDDNDDDDSDDDDDSSEDDDESDGSMNESFEVIATRAGRRGPGEEITINRLSELKRLAKTRKYDHFEVKDRSGRETDYTVDPQGNLVEM